jgi:2-C-methyl-D-erythritol 2,4-cyclodiphosphate synthase
MYRTGIGYDSHRFKTGRKLVLGGIDVPFEKGLDGHSDADVLCHSIIDAILGGAGLGDIGQHFPDTDEKWKDASSIALLKRVVELVNSEGFEVSWIDSTIITEAPKIVPFLAEMKKAISTVGIPSDNLNIKATTNEGMGFIGRGEGIAVISVCTLQKID